jgi:hypothetical protein
MSPVFLFVMSSSPLEKAGAVTSGQLEQDLNQRSPGNLYNGAPAQSTPDTQPTLLGLEAIVERGLCTYQSVGAALDQIHSGKLYKPRYKSLNAYLEQRWGISRAHAYRLMSVATKAKMSSAGDKPANEHQARKRESARASNKITSLPDDSRSLPNGIVTDAEAEAFKRQIVRLQKFLSIEGEFLILKKLKDVIDDRLAALDREKQGEVAP